MIMCLKTNKIMQLALIKFYTVLYTEIDNYQEETSLKKDLIITITASLIYLATCYFPRPRL